MSGAGWQWGGNRHQHWRHNYRQRSEPKKGCVAGHCSRKWDCPRDAAVLEPTGLCAYLRGDVFVCCYRGDERGARRDPWGARPPNRSNFGDSWNGIDSRSRKEPIDDKMAESRWDGTSDQRGRGPNRRKNRRKEKHGWWEEDDRRHKTTERTAVGSATTPRSNATPRWKTTVKPTVAKPKQPRVFKKKTTPVPQFNEQICGLREVQSVTSRRKNPDGEPVVIYPDVGAFPVDAIVGGEEVEPFSWPWVAALYRETAPGVKRFLSAGSLINANFVLTAAHVFRPQDLRAGRFLAMLGTHTADEAVAEYRVQSVLQHPEYRARFYYHDIALLKLEATVVFNHYVTPICLPTPAAKLLRDSDLVGRNVTVMGWGDQSFGGVSSRVLKEATFPIVSREACNASYVRVAKNRFPRGITKEMICAGDPGGGKDACQGDSGGPLTVKEGDRYVQVGIVSFGYQCGDKDYPGVYTKVAPYLTWIVQNTQGVSSYYYGS